MINITQEHNEDRLAGSLLNLMRGSNPPSAHVYEGPRPGSAATAPTGATLLAIITLQDPPGTVSGGLLTLNQAENGLVLVDGTADWIRFKNGNLDPSFDVDVDNGSNNGEAVMASRTLFAGGEVKLVTCILG